MISHKLFQLIFLRVAKDNFRTKAKNEEDRRTRSRRD